MHRTYVRALTSFIAVILLTTGCSSSGREVGTETPGTAATNPATTSTTDAATTTTAPDAVLNIGDTYTTPSGTALTVYEFRTNTPNADPAPADVLPNGLIWASADVELCRAQDDDPRPVATDAWQLKVGNGRITIANVTYRNALVPAWDFTTTAGDLAPGACFRGWALFEVPADVAVSAVTFVNVETGPPPEWTVSAAA